MDHYRGPTCAYAAPSRPPKVFRATHSQRSRQHCQADRNRSGGQSGAALATPGRHDGAAGAGAHPQTETMGTTAPPVARLERALAHGKTPKPSEWSQFRYGAHTARIASGASRWQRSLRKRPSNGTGHRQTGQTDASRAKTNLARRDLGGLRDARCERRQSRSAERRRTEPRRFSSTKDDDASGFQARCASS